MARFESSLEDQIVVVRKLFTSFLCQRYVSFLAGLPLVTTPGLPKKGDALRANDRYEVNDPHFAAKLFGTTALKKLIEGSSYEWGGEVCGLNPRIRIYRYTKGQFFDKHYDDSNVVELPLDPPMRAKTTWTLLLYLTGPSTGCKGGETVFYPEHGHTKLPMGQPNRDKEAIAVSPEVGMALLHKHGHDCLLHEGKEVTAGEKWIIRTDLCVKR
ncbi:MAG: hypothetical protein LQ340_004149 [Diploschistes diacapsis]|nr:MAG: hypothetical protein LQ340_004149 [Diploschistes diacapsis]